MSKPTSEDIQEGVRQAFWECIDNGSVTRNRITSEDVQIGVRSAVKQWLTENKTEVLESIAQAASHSH